MNELISTYFKNYKRFIEGKSQNDTIWAVEKIEHLVKESPMQGLEAVIQLIKESDDDETLSYIAAGPLENLLVFNGSKIVDRLTKIADNDERIQLALSGVWLGEKEDDFYHSWRALMKRYGFIGNNPKKGL